MSARALAVSMVASADGASDGAAGASESDADVFSATTQPPHSLLKMNRVVQSADGAPRRAEVDAQAMLCELSLRDYDVGAAEGALAAGEALHRPPFYAAQVQSG